MEQSDSQRKKEDVNESLNDSLNNSTSSLCASWETKLLRSDLIESQSRVSAELPVKCQLMSLLLLFLDITAKKGDPASVNNSNGTGIKVCGKREGT